ncbi:MAG TPA: PEP-CTERM sorting domain-containing protein [Leptolyngbyaceae cyanobacterium M33_DOE_097]|uniref:PEP-CTERM sorting domain-containing protein n=1 Tax=Oscillatoriales cyanobacterium SpSt-418 TaxID=2282169 RepID=A0A7C3PFR3_9CYAN|nr:PEP-CTERM sorting domain-containing protein [Leptolyngbyaceae cyanobacterium M33_DOE_097]
MNLSPKNLFQKTFALTSAIAATATLAPLSAQAATFSSSNAAVTINNFSVEPVQADAFTDAVTNTVAFEGSVDATANADATFTGSSAFNTTDSTVQGQGLVYSGDAASFAQVAGFFILNPGSVFSYNFTVALDLTVKANEPQDNASAFGNVLFELFDNASGELIDQFGVTGELFATSNKFTPWNPFNYIPSDFVEVTDFSSDINFDGTTTNAKTEISGIYSRQFGSPITLRLQETKLTGARAEAVPEPSEIVGTMIAGSLLFVGLRRRSRLRKEAQISI